jgi:hypothetical protein
MTQWLEKERARQEITGNRDASSDDGCRAVFEAIRQAREQLDDSEGDQAGCEPTQGFRDECRRCRCKGTELKERLDDTPIERSEKDDCWRNE